MLSTPMLPPCPATIAVLCGGGWLRHELTASVSDAYLQAGFTVIAQDVVLGEHLAAMTALIRSRPLLVVVLAPQPAGIAARETARGKTAYGPWAIGQLDDLLRYRTPCLGLWLDTTGQSPAETVDEILSRAWTEAVIPGKPSEDARSSGSSGI